jgi:hypothetical protein
MTSLPTDEIRKLVREVLKEAFDEFAREVAKANDTGNERGGVAERKGTHRIDKGVLTEAMVVEIGRSNSRVIIGKTVAVTPLARDKAREVKLEIVREKP